MCIEPENLQIWGNNNTNERRILYVILKRCTGFDYCADEKEAKKWFRQKQIKLIMNRHRLNAELIGERSIIRDSFTEYFQVFSSVQQEIPFRLQRTKVEDQNQLVNLYDITEVQNPDLFDWKRESHRPFELGEEYIMAVSLELDMD